MIITRRPLSKPLALHNYTMEPQELQQVIEIECRKRLNATAIADYLYPLRDPQEKALADNVEAYAAYKQILAMPPRKSAIPSVLQEEPANASPAETKPAPTTPIDEALSGALTCYVAYLLGRREMIADNASKNFNEPNTALLDNANKAFDKLEEHIGTANTNIAILVIEQVAKNTIRMTLDYLNSGR